MTTLSSKTAAPRSVSGWRSAQSKRILLTLLGWSVALVIFFPIFWMILTGFKTETAAIADPSLIFSPTLESYQDVHARSGYARFALNSVAVAFGSTFFALLIAIPSAYAMAFLPLNAPKARCCGCSPPKCCPQWACWCRFISFSATLVCSTPAPANHHLYPDEPADCGVDALHLLQGYAQRHS